MIDRYLLRQDWIMRRVGVIGGGRVGAVLAAAFARAGYPVVAVATESAANRARVRQFLPDVPFHPPHAVAAAAELVLLAVPDDALDGLVEGLASTIRTGQVVAHTSGAHGLAVL